MVNQKKILFLYTELASYFLACVGELAKTQNLEIHIVRWPVNKEAPFEFENLHGNVFLYDKHNFNTQSLLQFVNKLKPHLIYCSGWMDKDYLSVCKKYKNNIPVVGGIDTQWTGSLKQKLRALTGFFSVKPYFSHLWVAGEPQKKYAQKLGYTNSTIIDRVYSADTNFFNLIFENSKEIKQNNFPHKFIYVGRYTDFKGITDLWKAFILTFETLKHDWELWCFGTGTLWEQRIDHPSIKHFGFVQPSQMASFMNDTGVFILPSHFEPWAVVVHEFAAAGFPLICSDKVGAATEFLRNSNGYLFKSGDIIDLKNKMLEIINTNDSTLFNMGIASHLLAQKHSPVKWSKSLLNILNS